MVEGEEVKGWAVREEKGRIRKDETSGRCQQLRKPNRWMMDREIWNDSTMKRSNYKTDCLRKGGTLRGGRQAE